MYNTEIILIGPDGKKIGCKVSCKNKKELADSLPKAAEAVIKKAEEKYGE